MHKHVNKGRPEKSSRGLLETESTSTWSPRHPTSTTQCPGRVAVVDLKYIRTMIYSIRVGSQTVIGTVSTENIFVQQITKKRWKLTAACIWSKYSIQPFDLLLQWGRGISGRCDFIPRFEYICIPVAFVALTWAVSFHLLKKWFEES